MDYCVIIFTWFPDILSRTIGSSLSKSILARSTIKNVAHFLIRYTFLSYLFFLAFKILPKFVCPLSHFLCQYFRLSSQNFV